ncbi:MAG: hypothetical protein FWC38_09865 [Proteobacteria bacterium]|nr:hypothetical protein [Pseudomonadota bacterium]
MKRSMFQAFGSAVFGSAVLALGLLSTAPVLAQGANVTYDGTNPGVLQQFPYGAPNISVLAPPGGMNSASRSNNVITLQNGGAVGSVYGAHWDDTLAAANGPNANLSFGENTVEIEGGWVNGDELDPVNWFAGEIVGTYVKASGAGDVGIKGASVAIRGGKIDVPIIVGAHTEVLAQRNAFLEHNHILLFGGEINAEHIIAAQCSIQGAGTNIARDNTLTIRGNPTFATRTILYGGLCTSSQRNRLNIETTGVVNVRGIDSFQQIGFLLPSTLANGDKMLVLGDYGSTIIVFGTGLQAEIQVIPPAPPAAQLNLATGNRYTLIENLFTTVAQFTPITGTLPGTLGTFGYRVELEESGVANSRNLVMTITSGPEVDLVIAHAVNYDTEQAHIGDPMQYRFQFFNNGPNNVVGATLQYTVPANIENVTWECEAYTYGTATACPNPSSGTGNNISLLVDLAARAPGSFPALVLTVKGTAAKSGVFNNVATLTVPAGMVESNPADNTFVRQVTIHPDADLDVSINLLTPASVNINDAVSYEIRVDNMGPDDAMSARVIHNVPSQLSNVTWACLASVGASCPANGAGNINMLVDIPDGEHIIITVNGTASTRGNNITSTATATPPTSVRHINQANSSASFNFTIVGGVVPHSSTASIPTLGGGVLVALGMLLAGLGAVRLRRSR